MNILVRKQDIVKDSDTGIMSLRLRKERVSLTFRKTLPGPCTCSFPSYCDRKTGTSEDSDKEKILGDETASKLEALHVHQVWDYYYSIFFINR